MCKTLTSQIHTYGVRRSQCTSVITILFHPCCPLDCLRVVFTHMAKGKFVVFTEQMCTYRIGLGQFHGLHQYGCRDVIKTLLYVPYEKIIFTCKVPFILRLFLCILYSTKHDTIYRHSSFVSRITNFIFLYSTYQHKFLTHFAVFIKCAFKKLTIVIIFLASKGGWL